MRPAGVPEAAFAASDRELAEWVRDARARTLALVADLSDEQLLGPRLAILNPLLWEIGHVAWFQEKWALRHAAGRAPLRADADALYDSAAIAHDTRWDLPLPGRKETGEYLVRVRDEILERIARGGLSEAERYFIQLGVFHEDMHTEAFTYTRQTLGYPAPVFGAAAAGEDGAAGSAGASAGAGEDARPAGADGCAGDAELAGGPFWLGAAPEDGGFVFDNEKWAHRVELAPFAIARAAVTQGEFLAFVEEGGYRRREWWSPAGWQWREQAQATQPVYWRRDGGRWWRRDFDRWVALEPERPVLHVNWHEAEAYCRWAGRRLPSEAEWEAAAALPGSDEVGQRRFPWGAAPPTAATANLDWRTMGAVDVAALAAGDSACGCRQMIGNVWEWTASDFGPYPGFTPDPYREYSQPWFGTHKVLRGGAWPTRARLLRNTWRNFYPPHRRDVWAGFRTCAAGNG